MFVTFIEPPWRRSDLFLAWGWKCGGIPNCCVESWRQDEHSPLSSACRQCVVSISHDVVNPAKEDARHIAIAYASTRKERWASLLNKLTNMGGNDWTRLLQGTSLICRPVRLASCASVGFPLVGRKHYCGRQRYSPVDQMCKPPAASHLV